MVCKWQVELDDYCQRVLQKHWPDVPRYRDVREIDELETVDLICGGFPCQSVSVAGKRRGQDDERWLWPQFDRIVRLVRPRYVLVENVPGILSANGGDTMSEVLGDLAASGFDCEWQSIPAAAVGAPHLRYRVFIVAYPNSIGLNRILFHPASHQSQTGREDAWRVVRSQPITDLWRSVDGVPSRVDRLRALGNAVVPQIAEWIGRQIIASEGG